jgi:hypothetical protein
MGLLLAVALVLITPLAQAVDGTVVVTIEYGTPPPQSFEAALRVRLDQSTVAGGRRLRIVSALEAEAGQPRERVILVKIRGECRVSARSVSIWRPDPLAWVDRVDGQILSFIHVDCTRLSEALSRIVPGAGAYLREPEIMGETRMTRAVALVIRHELRHILLQSSAHDTRGEYKAALRPEELIR